MTPNSNQKPTPSRSPTTGADSAPEPPLRSFLEVERLMQELGLTPADCLVILRDALLDLQEAERRAEEAKHLPLPYWCYGSL